MQYDGCLDVMFANVVCLSLRKVRIGEARHVSSWGNPDRNACHMSLGDVRHASLGGGVPTYMAILHGLSMSVVLGRYGRDLKYSKYDVEKPSKLR